ncbi:MAG: hypothetical protein KC503_32870 [Myxococcales bacterium]|nr:hypothetical protein [Myxococcales bacterium]
MRANRARRTRRQALLLVAALLLTAAAAIRCDSSGSQTACVDHGDCPADQRCNRASGLCFVGARPPDGGGGGDGGGDAAPATPGVSGQIKCRYFDKLTLSYPDTEAGIPRPDLALRWDGKTFGIHFACAVWPDSNYVWLSFIGLETSTTKPVAERHRAELVIYMRPEDYKTQTLSVPSRALGWLQVAPGEGKAQQTVAAVWGSKLTLSAVTQTVGADVEGSFEIELVPFMKKPYGSECALHDTYASGDKPRQALLLSPDCRSDTDCYPYLDGSAKGYCTRICLDDSECKVYDPTSRCIRGTGSGSCLTSCAGDGDCKQVNAAMVCHPQEKVCYKP